MINQWIGFGRLCAEPELKTTNSGMNIVSVNIAVETGSGDKKTTNFLPIVAFGKSAELINRYFHSGSLIGVRAKATSREYNDKNGNKRTAIEFVVDEIQFAQNPPANQQQQTAQPSQPQQTAAQVAPQAPTYAPPPQYQPAPQMPLQQYRQPAPPPQVYTNPYTPDSELPF